MLTVLDYGIGNVRSVLNALSYLGIDAHLSREPADIRAARGLILPGVGAFGEGMRRVGEYGLRPLLHEVASSGKPLLGICLGFELLMRSSDELGAHSGLALLPFDVHRLGSKARLPHIGWTPVRTSAVSASPPRLLRGLEGEAFYFVHSYGVETLEPGYTSASAVYGGCELMAVVEHGNVFGTQFHPEKSGEAGLALLRNFADLLS